MQCSKLRVPPALGVHILAAGCMDLKPCAPGVCMYIQNYILYTFSFGIIFMFVRKIRET